MAPVRGGNWHDGLCAPCQWKPGKDNSDN
jgi:hypothetical protein